MGINATTQTVDDQATNMILQMRRELDDMKNNPQPIGNGSIAYGIYTTTVAGPFTVAADSMFSLTTTYFPTGVTTTYAGLPALNLPILLDLYASVCVDANGINNALPGGSSLSPGQMNSMVSVYRDLLNSGVTSGNGQQRWVITVKNFDNVSHNYYMNINALIPRPALKRI